MVKSIEPGKDDSVGVGRNVVDAAPAPLTVRLESRFLQREMPKMGRSFRLSTDLVLRVQFAVQLVAKVRHHASSLSREH